MQWAVVVFSFELDQSSSKVVGLPVEIGDTVQVLEKASDKWWLCGDGEDVGYIPPSCLLETTPNTEDDSSESSSLFELDLVSILKSVEDSSSSSESSNKRRVSFSTEHQVHVIPRGTDTNTATEKKTVNYMEPIVSDDYNSTEERSKKRKFPTLTRRKSYGYFSNPEYKSGYNQYHTFRCEDDVCHYWRDENHDNCYNSGEFIAPESTGLVAESISFISGLFGDKKKKEEEEEEGRSSFSLMSLLIPRD